MTGDTPADLAAALDTHGSLTREGGNWKVTTTVFDTTVTATHEGCAVMVRVPTLQAATADEVGDAVATDWLRTFRRRLEDAPSATRRTVELDDRTVEVTDETVRVSFEFACPDPGGAAEIATTLAEFVEGTYVGGVVPGYAYDPPVADLLAAASQGDNGAPL